MLNAVELFVFRTSIMYSRTLLILVLTVGRQYHSNGCSPKGFVIHISSTFLLVSITYGILFFHSFTASTSLQLRL